MNEWNKLVDAIDSLPDSDDMKFVFDSAFMAIYDGSVGSPSQFDFFVEKLFKILKEYKEKNCYE